jgi:PAS domain-containing protein
MNDQLNNSLTPVADEQSRLRDLVQASPISMPIGDAASGQVVFANDEIRRITGVQFQVHTPLKDYSGSLTLNWPDGRTIDPRYTPFRRAMTDGTSVPVLVSAMLVMDPEGRVSGAIAVTQDLSTRADLERMRSEFLALVSQGLRPSGLPDLS